jgi:hypothetical protein
MTAFAYIVAEVIIDGLVKRCISPSPVKGEEIFGLFTSSS